MKKWVLIVLAVLVLATACKVGEDSGGNGGETPGTAPVLQTLSPDAVMVNPSPFFLTARGEKFNDNSIIVFNGVTGTANTKVSLLIEVASILFYLALAYYLALVLKTTTTRIGMSEIVYFFLLGALSVGYLWRGKWAAKEI